MGKSILKGAFILSLGGISARIIGAVFRILLPRFIEGEGIGIYHMAYSFYAITFVLAIPGIPLAMSRLIAQEEAEGHPENSRVIFAYIFTTLAATGLLVATLLFIFSDFFAHRFLGDSAAALPMKALAPSILLVWIISAFRAYFQGKQNMSPVAFSHVFEQLMRVIFVILFFTSMTGLAKQYLAAGASLGTFAGALGALVYLFLVYLIDKRKQNTSSREASVKYSQIIRKTLKLALPITIGAIVVSSAQIVDATIIPRRLQEMGLSLTEARDHFGQFTGMALALFNLPLVFAVSLAISLVPAVSEAHTLRNEERLAGLVRKSLKAGLFLVIPSAIGLFVLGPEICGLLFGYPQAGIILRYLSPGLIFMGVQQVAAGILQGLEKTTLPARNLMAGTIVAGIITYIMTYRWGINGAALARVIGMALTAILNYSSLKKHVACRFDWCRCLVKPFLAGSIMGILVYYISDTIIRLNGSAIMAIILALSGGGFLYLLLSLLLGSIYPRELKTIPVVGTWFKRWF